jgi:hypothetical protein
MPTIKPITIVAMIPMVGTSGVGGGDVAHRRVE